MTTLPETFHSKYKNVKKLNLSQKTPFFLEKFILHVTVEVSFDHLPKPLRLKSQTIHIILVGHKICPSKISAGRVECTSDRPAENHFAKSHINLSLNVRKKYWKRELSKKAFFINLVLWTQRIELWKTCRKRFAKSFTRFLLKYWTFWKPSFFIN